MLVGHTFRQLKPKTSSHPYSGRIPVDFTYQWRTLSSMVTKTKAGSTSTTNNPPSTASDVLSNNSSSSSDSRISPHENGIVTDQLRVTNSCVERIRALSSKRQEPSYLRVFVDAGGCSGFQYKFDMTEDSKEPVDPVEDVVFQSSNGARLVVDLGSLDFIKGSTIDFVQEMIKSSFAVVNNPQSESACGCGSSFAIKKFQSNPALD